MQNVYLQSDDARINHLCLLSVSNVTSLDELSLFPLIACKTTGKLTVEAQPVLFIYVYFLLTWLVCTKYWITITKVINQCE